jgi:hypothetical protein
MPNRKVLLMLAGAAVAGVVIGLLVSGRSGGGPVTQTRARVYANADACLLTGVAGIADPAVAPVWAGMEDASLATRVRTSYLTVTGPATEANALPFLGALLVRGCAVVVATGSAERAAALADAARFPAVKFVVFGAGKAPSNVTVLAVQASGVRTAVAGVISGATG